jgi:hypothetical protein
MKLNRISLTKTLTDFRLEFYFFRDMGVGSGYWYCIGNVVRLYTGKELYLRRKNVDFGFVLLKWQVYR